MAKTDWLSEAMKYHMFLQQLKGTKLTNQAKEYNIAKGVFDLKSDIEEHNIKLNKEKRDQDTHKATKRKDALAEYNKERDEHQENYDLAEKIAPGSGIEYLNNLSDAEKQYVPHLSAHAENVKGQGSLVISDVNSILVNSELSPIEKKKQIEAIKTANPNISSGATSNIDGAIGMVDNMIHDQVKTYWLKDNPNHPDAGRVGLLPAGDAYKEILEKDALKDINVVFNRVTKSTDAAFQLEMLEGSDIGVDVKGVKKMVGDRLKQDIRTINDASRQVSANDDALYNEAFLGVKKRNPQYFDSDNNRIKPGFESIVSDSINIDYNKRLRQRQQQP